MLHTNVNVGYSTFQCDPLVVDKEGVIFCGLACKATVILPIKLFVFVCESIELEIKFLSIA
jgi:hypothetical protein